MKQNSKLIWIGMITLILSCIIEYLGWVLASNYSIQGEKAVFLSLQTLGSIFQNTIGAILFSVPFIAFAFFFPSFRKNWKSKIHIPIWIGVLLFCTILILLTIWGILSV